MIFSFLSFSISICFRYREYQYDGDDDNEQELDGTRKYRFNCKSRLTKTKRGDGKNIERRREHGRAMLYLRASAFTVSRRYPTIVKLPDTSHPRNRSFKAPNFRAFSRSSRYVLRNLSQCPPQLYNTIYYNIIIAFFLVAY